MNLIDEDTDNRKWFDPSDEDPREAFMPVIDNHVDAEICIPFCFIEPRAKNDCEHWIDDLEREGFRSRI